jgi:3-isopropylmalate dehydrogenase
MSSVKNIFLLPGDGIGHEVMPAARKVADWFQTTGRTKFEFTEGLIGGASYDAHGTPLTAETVAQAKTSDAVLLACIGGPKWDTLPFGERPERGILGIRKEMGLFANLRPAVVFDALAGASSLKREVVQGLDIMIIRELIGGLYFGEPRGIEDVSGGRRGFNTMTYSTPEIERIARVGFELARKRGKRLCSVDKANVLESSVLWREEITKLHAAEYADVELSHMYVDACAMHLAHAPRDFDVIVTENMFGDILSDLSATLTGSIGMLPSASFGAADASDRQPAIFEPVHGSAPDIAGQGIANPLAIILSFAMMMRYSFSMDDNADLVERAVQNVLKAGVRTADIVESGQTPVSTNVMADAVVNELGRLA